MNTAAVVDLQEFRARRASRPAQGAQPVQAPPRALAPFWLVWVPVWPVR